MAAEERYLPGSSRRDAVERIAEIQHRLVVEEGYGEFGRVRGSLDLEEELLDEIRELEQALTAEETGQKAPREERKGASEGEQR